MYGHFAEVCRNYKEHAGAIQTDSKPSDSKEVQTDETRTECDKSLNTVKGRIGNHIVNTLRDSGCTAICVDRKFIQEDQLTGQYRRWKLIDGTERKLMTAIADIDTPYLTKKQATVVCMDNPTFELVIGDVEGAACKCNPKSDWTIEDDEAIAAVTTRAQAKADKKPINPFASESH